MANERQPDDPLPADFEPEGAVATHRVSDGENWASVAAKYNVNVKDLIYFNFHTNIPEEVNWYLRRNTGCNVSKDGGRNWAFSSSADPGIIYIPPSEVIVHDPGAGTLLVLVERIGFGWFRFAWNRDVQEDEVGPLLFEGGMPSGIEITKEASGAFLVSGIRSEMIYDQQLDQRVRREIVPKLINAPDGKPPVTERPVPEGHAPGVGVELDENAVLEWVHKSLEGTHYIAGVVEVVEVFHTPAGLAAVAGTSLASVVGGIASYIIMLWAVVRAFGTGRRLQEQEGFCYGVMWETFGKPNGDKAFLAWAPDSAEDLREAFYDGVGQGREKAKDIKVHNRVMVAVGYYMVNKGSNEDWAQSYVLNDLWKKVRETDKGKDTLTWPDLQDMQPLIPD